MAAENPSFGKPIREILVLGGGTAGFLAALGLRKHLPDCRVRVVRSTAMGVIGVGEGTICSVVHFLHRFLEIDEAEFHREVHPTIKLGIRYLWGPRPYFYYSFTPQFSALLPGTDWSRGYLCRDTYEFADESSALMRHDKVCLRNPAGGPRLAGGYAYHLENRRLVGWLETLADRHGVEKLDAVVTGVVRSGDQVQALELDDGRLLEADLFVDCSGFASRLIGEAPGRSHASFGDALFCDGAVIGGWERSEADPFRSCTTVETMQSGWCWQIEHDQWVNRGYVFSSSFLSPDDAEREFRNANPRVEHTRLVPFRCGAERKPWVGNSVAIGNAAGFVEPLEATAIGVICDSIVRLVRALKGSGQTLDSAVAEAYNRVQFENWEIIRDFLALHYRFNRRIDSPFWQACLHDVPLGRTQPWVDYYRAVGPDFSAIGVELNRDFFDVEGYLALLVGQQVPYRRRVEFSLRDRQQWRNLQSRLSDAVLSAMSMPEYLAAVRGDAGLGPLPGNVHRSGYAGVGELQWH